MTPDHASRIRSAAVATLGALVVGAGVGACATSPEGGSSSSASGAAAISVVAAESCWGDLARQLGGDRVKVVNIVDNPAADPHDYEPTAADGRAVATSRMVIVNGVGYDPWATRLIEANPADSRVVLNVGETVGAGKDANPHRWYSPPDVRKVIDRITAEYKRLSPSDTEYFDSQHAAVVDVALKGYFDLTAEIAKRFGGTPVGASESIFAMLAGPLGLDLVTPESFLDAISEGADPTAADKATVDRQIREKQVKVYVYNGQNANPDVQAQVDAAKAVGIPVVTVTETPEPGTSFQDWQVAQLTALRQALATATGK